MTTPHRTLQMALDALDAITDDVDGTGLNTMPSFDKAIDAIAALRAALAQPEPIDGFGGNLDEAFERAECCRNELLTALHSLASNYENALGMFGQDGEGRRKAEGDLEHTMKVAAKHNRNGPGCAAPAAPLTTQQITQIARKHGIVYTNRHYSESPAVAFSQNGLMAFLAEVGIGGGGK